MFLETNSCMAIYRTLFETVNPCTRQISEIACSQQLFNTNSRIDLCPRITLVPILVPRLVRGSLGTRLPRSQGIYPQTKLRITLVPRLMRNISTDKLRTTLVPRLMRNISTDKLLHGGDLNPKPSKYIVVIHDRRHSPKNL